MAEPRRRQQEERKSSMRDRARRRAEERENQGGGGTKYNLPDGVQFYSPKKHANLDIIPYTVSVDNHPENVPNGEYWYQRSIFVHYGVGAEEKSYLCLKTLKKKCPICEQRSMLMKDPNADEDLIKSLRPKERELYNIYDRDDVDKGVQLWDISNFNFGQKLEEELREGKPEWAGFAEPVDGYTLKVRFSEEQIGANKFMQASRIDFEKRDGDISKKILDKALDLDKILKVLSYEQLEKIFLGVDGEGSGEEENGSSKEAEPRSPSRLARSSGQDKDQEEEEAPPRRRARASEELAAEPERVEKSAKAAAASANKCPAGGVFGKDCDELKACKDCDIWEQCIEEQERLAK
jgi:hypothetical protein